jgi:hypothetical protein
VELLLDLNVPAMWKQRHERDERSNPWKKGGRIVSANSSIAGEETTMRESRRQVRP